MCTRGRRSAAVFSLRGASSCQWLQRDENTVAFSGIEAVTFRLLYKSVGSAQSLHKAKHRRPWADSFPPGLSSNSFMLSAARTSPTVCLFFLPQLICSRKNKTQDVKQKISDYLEGKDTHWYFLQQPFVPVCTPFPPISWRTHTRATRREAWLNESVCTILFAQQCVFSVNSPGFSWWW